MRTKQKTDQDIVISSALSVEFYSFTHNHQRLLDFIRGMGIGFSSVAGEGFTTYKFVIKDQFQIDAFNKFVAETRKD